MALRIEEESAAIAAAPKEAALYSNRSFSFLRLGLPARALACRRRSQSLRTAPAADIGVEFLTPNLGAGLAG